MSEPGASEAPKVGFRDSLGPVGLYPLVILFLLNMVDEFDRVTFGALSPEIRDAFGLSNSAFLSIVSLSAALPILLAVPVGYLADRLNRVRMAQAAAVVWAAAAVVVGVAPAVAVLVIARLVGGTGRLVNEPVHPSLLSDYYPPASLPRVFGMHRWANTAGLLAAPIAGLMGAVFGWRLTFVVMAIPTLVLLVFSTRLREPRRSGPADEEQERISLGEGFRRVRAIRSLRRTWVAAFLFGSGVLPVASFLTLFFEEVYGMGPVVRGMITGLAGAGGTVGLLIGTRMADRVMTRWQPQRLPVITGLWIVEFGIGLFLMAIAPWVGVSMVFAFVLYMGAAGFLPAYLSMVALTAPPRLRAQAFSYSLLFYALGGLVLSPIAGAIGDEHGLRVGVVILSALVAAGGVVATTVKAFVHRDIEQATKASEARQMADDALLVCKGLDVAYDQVQVLFGVDFRVEEGEIVALLGTNGAGKTTMLRAISGIADPIGGAIYFGGRDITHADPNTTAALGIVQVPGGRGIFPGLTVAENLRIAGWLYRRDPSYRGQSLDTVLEQFPVLRQRFHQVSGSLSGGEQQMLSLAMAFIAKPRLLLIDELSLGLAPTIVDRLLDIVRAIHQAGTTVVLVEQSVNTALQVADRCAFMEKGEIRFEGPTKDLLERPEVLRAVYLQGTAAALEGSEAAQPEVSEEALEAAAEIVDEDEDRRRASRSAVAPVVLEAKGLSKHYGGIVAVNAVDLALHEGEILGLIGPNGAGKTTLFDLMSGFQRADEGRILLHGVDVTSRPAHARALARLGRTFQDARLFPSLTVTEALAVAFERHVPVRAALPALMGTAVVARSEAAIGRRVEELIELMGLSRFRDKFVSELSTGTRRMVEIAAMVAHGPSVLILDEPSSGIAQRETEALVPLLRAVRQHMGCSLLVIEHDMPLITSLADRIVALEEGTVIAEGTPEEIVRHPRVVASYLGSMAEELHIGGNGERSASDGNGGAPRLRRRKTAQL